MTPPALRAVTLAAIALSTATTLAVLTVVSLIKRPIDKHRKPW